jgi:hypothetical protein
MARPTLEQLKSTAYDLFVQLNQVQARLKQVEQAIAEYKPEPKPEVKPKEDEKPKEEVKPEEKK